MSHCEKCGCTCGGNWCNDHFDSEMEKRHVRLNLGGGCIETIPEIRWQDCPQAHKEELPAGFMKAAREWMEAAARSMRTGNGGIPSIWRDDIDAQGSWSAVVREYEEMGGMVI